MWHSPWSVNERHKTARKKYNWNKNFRIYSSNCFNASVLVSQSDCAENVEAKLTKLVSGSILVAASDEICRTYSEIGGE